eukprot:3322505-Pleurochrysis_carterae.AAC.1
MSDASRQRTKAVEVPKFAAVPIELRREPGAPSAPPTRPPPGELMEKEEGEESEEDVNQEAF